MLVFRTCRQPANENYVQPKLGDATEWLNALLRRSANVSVALKCQISALQFQYGVRGAAYRIVTAAQTIQDIAATVLQSELL